jgi:hypothetical protein
MPIPGEDPNDWLSGICTYFGPGSDLPVGGFCKIPGWKPDQIAQFWVVQDAMSDDGSIINKKTKELLKDDIIIGVQLNANTLNAIVASYGRDFFQIREANGGPLLTLDNWQELFGSNGLGLVALRNIRRKINGGGIHF